MITIETLCAELDEANAVAKANGQAGAMVSATTLRAKLGGLLRDKVEISAPSPFSQCKSTTELLQAMLRDLGVLHPRPEQVEQARALMETHLNEWQALAEGRGPITINAVAQPIGGHRKSRRRLAVG